jgi:hypothetical protein
MIDAKGNFYGVTADILRLVRLRTGLHFDPVPADSIRRMEDQIAGKRRSSWARSARARNERSSCGFPDPILRRHLCG